MERNIETIGTKLVIGLIGEKGSGKGLFVELLKKLGEKANLYIAAEKSSNILAETLTLWGLPLTRSNLQQLAIIMNAKYGPTTLSDAVKHRINNDFNAKIVMYDGIRWPADVEMIRSFPKNTLVYITAPAEIRYKRTLERHEKAGEGSATFEQFMAEEQVATETQIVEISKQADIRIENIGTREEFEGKVKDFFENFLSTKK